MTTITNNKINILSILRLLRTTLLIHHFLRIVLLFDCLCSLNFSKKLSIALWIMCVEIAKIILVLIVIVILVSITIVVFFFSFMLICMTIICAILACTAVRGMSLLAFMNCALVRLFST